EQNTSRQVSQAPDGYIVLEDKISGSIPFAERPSGAKIIKMAETGELSELRVHSITRLGRNQIDILSTIKKLTALEVNVTSKKEGLSTLNEAGLQSLFTNMLIGVLSSLAEFELELSKERRQEGIAEAKAKGRYTGRAKGSSEDVDQFLNKKKTQDVIKYLKEGESIRRASKLAGASTTFVQKVKKIAADKELI
ncbi:recombinase family protein, partial [Flavobacteriaceae bacterium]|nr:recombinase family protein [Flavobacteriaceae bacterium]